MIAPVVIPATVDTWTRLHAGDEDFLAHVLLASDEKLDEALGVLRARQVADGGQYMRYAAVRAEQRRRKGEQRNGAAGA